MLRELDSRKEFPANHDEVRSSSLSQPDAQLPAVPADLRLFDMSFSRPEAKSPDFPNAEVPYNPEIEDTVDMVIQSMNLSLPDAEFNPVVSSLLDLQCSPPPAVLSQSRCPSRTPHASPERIHAAIHQYASTNTIAAKYSGIEPQCADL